MIFKPFQVQHFRLAVAIVAAWAFIIIIFLTFVVHISFFISSCTGIANPRVSILHTDARVVRKQRKHFIHPATETASLV